MAYSPETLSTLRHKHAALQHEVQQLRDRLADAERRAAVAAKTAADAWAFTKLMLQARRPDRTGGH